MRTLDHARMSLTLLRGKLPELSILGTLKPREVLSLLKEVTPRPSGMATAEYERQIQNIQQALTSRLPTLGTFKERQLARDAADFVSASGRTASPESFSAWLKNKVRTDPAYAYQLLRRPDLHNAFVNRLVANGGTLAEANVYLRTVGQVWNDSLAGGKRVLRDVVSTAYGDVGAATAGAGYGMPGTSNVPVTAVRGGGDQPVRREVVGSVRMGNIKIVPSKTETWHTEYDVRANPPVGHFGPGRDRRTYIISKLVRQFTDPKAPGYVKVDGDRIQQEIAKAERTAQPWHWPPKGPQSNLPMTLFGHTAPAGEWRDILSHAWAQAFREIQERQFLSTPYRPNVQVPLGSEVGVKKGIGEKRLLLLRDLKYRSGLTYMLSALVGDLPKLRRTQPQLAAGIEELLRDPTVSARLDRYNGAVGGGFPLATGNRSPSDTKPYLHAKVKVFFHEGRYYQIDRLGRISEARWAKDYNIPRVSFGSAIRVIPPYNMEEGRGYVDEHGFDIGMGRRISFSDRERQSGFAVSDAWRIATQGKPIARNIGVRSDPYPTSLSAFAAGGWAGDPGVSSREVNIPGREVALQDWRRRKLEYRHDDPSRKLGAMYDTMITRGPNGERIGQDTDHHESELRAEMRRALTASTWAFKTGPVAMAYLIRDLGLNYWDAVKVQQEQRRMLNEWIDFHVLEHRIDSMWSTVTGRNVDWSQVDPDKLRELSVAFGESKHTKFEPRAKVSDDRFASVEERYELEAGEGPEFHFQDMFAGGNAVEHELAFSRRILGAKTRDELQEISGEVERLGPGKTGGWHAMRLIDTQESIETLWRQRWNELAGPTAGM